MACILDTFNPACDAQNVAGGIYGKLYIAKRSDIATAPQTLGVVTAVTMVGAAVFYEFTFVTQKASQTEAGARSESGAMFYTATLKGTLSASTPEARTFAEGLSGCTCGLVWVFTDGAGVQWITGLRNEGAITGAGLGDNALVTEDSSTTGDAMTSANTQDITLVSMCTVKARKTTQDFSLLV